jgi:hypothetical protein
MLVLLFDLFISILITLMVYSLTRWIGLPENVSGFIGGCVYVVVLKILRGKDFNQDD